MRTKMFVVAISVLFLMAAVPSLGADVTGKWEGEMAAPKMQGGPGGGGPGGGGPGGGMGPQGPMKFTFDLKTEGDKLSGSVKGPFGPANEFTDGKMDGNKLSFSYKTQGFQGNDMTIKWDGTLSGEEITFTMGVEGGMGGPGGGGMPPMKVVAKRVK
jgi:hypothetical protein